MKGVTIGRRSEDGGTGLGIVRLSPHNEHTCSCAHWLKVHWPFFPFHPKQYCLPLRSARGASAVVGFRSSKGFPLTSVFAMHVLGLCVSPPQKRHRHRELVDLELELEGRKESAQDLLAYPLLVVQA